MDFDSLWGSQQFRSLFIGHARPFKSKDLFDRNLAEEMWFNRFPKFEMEFCQQEGCAALVSKGAYCKIHYEYTSKETPEWVIVNGQLYKWTMFRYGDGRMKKRWEYYPYAKWVAEKKFEKVPSGYEAFFVDRNRLNCREDNLILMLSAVVDIIHDRNISLFEALDVDDHFGDLLEKAAGRKPFRAYYGYGDIAEAGGVSHAAVRKAVERDKLNPSSLKSIVEFVNARKNSDNGR